LYSAQQGCTFEVRTLAMCTVVFALLFFLNGSTWYINLLIGGGSNPPTPTDD